MAPRFLRRFCAPYLVSMAAAVMASDDTYPAVEIHDPIRGVAYYSVAFSSDALSSLRDPELATTDAASEAEAVTFGFSAFFFDASATVDEYVLWIRHEGNSRWFALTQQPLSIVADDVVMEPSPLHFSRAEQVRRPLIETLEFALSPSEFQQILDAEAVTLLISTQIGPLRKTLREAERTSLRAFASNVRERHERIRNAVAVSNDRELE